MSDEPRLCTATDIHYKAFKRIYGTGPSYVLELFASCGYPTGPHKIFFESLPGKPQHFRLLENGPHAVFGMTTYYAAAYSSSRGIPDLGDTVVIVDAAGEHEIAVREDT